MKRLKYLIILMLLFSCTEYEENFINEQENYKKIKAATLKTKLPIVHLRVNPEQFQNIHTNFHDDTKIKSFLSIYRNNKFVVKNILTDIKIKGAVSAELPLKSLGVIFDKTIDNTYIISPQKILPRHDLSSLKAIRLRNSGNDFSFSMLKQVCYTELAIQAGLNLDLNYSEQAIVFVNDVFHGIMNINSEVNSNGISKLYNINKDDITLAKVVGPRNIQLKGGSQEKLEHFLQKIEDRDIDYLMENIDQDNLIDYLIFQTFIANMDWPYNNVRFYSVNDGKWRFSIFDLDRANTLYIHKTRKGFIESTTDDIILTELFLLMLENEKFKSKYDNRYESLMKSEVFTPAVFDGILNKKSNNIEAFMPFQIQKYGIPNTMTEWYLNLESLKSNYKKRHTYLSNDLSR